jgi:hypothetical protein
MPRLPGWSALRILWDAATEHDPEDHCIRRLRDEEAEHNAGMIAEVIAKSGSDRLTVVAPRKGQEGGRAS